MTDTDHDHIDALAREAGSALRRAPSPDVLLRVHRAKRNRQVARAAGGGAALVALVAGGVLLLQRDADERLVPATVPSTLLPSTPGTTLPVTAPATTAPDTRVTTLAPAPTTVPPLASAPELLYLGNEDRAGEQVQRVVDLDTLEVLRTEPLDDATYRDYSGWTEPRSESASGIGYSLGSYPGDDPSDGVPVSDWCGRFPLEVDGAPAGALALPERASFIAVSDDGRWLLTIGAATCPVDGLVDPTTNVEQIDYEQEIRLFDADDPAAPGRLLWTSPYPERQFTGAQFSSDGRWMAITHALTAVDAAGVLTAQRGLDVVELATGRVTEPPDPTCTIVEYGQDGRLFVRGAGYVVTKQCADGIYVEVNALADGTRHDWLLPGVPLDAYVTAEVWPSSTIDSSTVFLATVSESADGAVTGRTFLGEKGQVRELPVTDARVSFGPLPEIVGD